MNFVVWTCFDTMVWLCFKCWINNEVVCHYTLFSYFIISLYLLSHCNLWLFVCFVKFINFLSWVVYKTYAVHVFILIVKKKTSRLEKGIYLTSTKLLALFSYYWLCIYIVITTCKDTIKKEILNVCKRNMLFVLYIWAGDNKWTFGAIVWATCS